VPFSNPILGGDFLVRPAMKSPNYVAGVSGWSINKDGTVEFNNGTFRGSISVGSPTGQHFVVNNSATGDVVDVYDSSNRLVMFIDATGTVNTVLQPAVDSLEMQGNALTFYNQSTPPSSRASVVGQSKSTGSHLIIDSGRGSASNDAVLWLLDALSSSDGKSYIRAQQKATNTQGPITGSVVQTDTDNSSRNGLHVATYSITTDAGGTSVFNHGAAFTPTEGFLAGVNGVAANFPYQYAWFPSPFTASTAKAAFKDNLGNALANTTLGVMGFFFG
jgi:hypothetical protein